MVRPGAGADDDGFGRTSRGPERADQWIQFNRDPTLANEANFITSIIEPWSDIQASWNRVFHLLTNRKSVPFIGKLDRRASPTGISPAPVELIASPQGSNVNVIALVTTNPNLVYKVTNARMHWALAGPWSHSDIQWPRLKSTALLVLHA